MGGVFVIYLYKNVDNIPIFDFYDMPEERILKRCWGQKSL